MVGVLGMVMSAASDAGWAGFIKFFLDGTFVNKDPRMTWLVPVTLIGLFVFRGIGRLPADLLPGLRRPAHRQDHARAALRQLPAPAGQLFRSRGLGRAAVASHLQHRAGRPGDHRLDHGVHPRHADDLRPGRLPAVAEPAAHAGQPHGRAADRVHGPPHQPAVPPLQPTHPEFHGRRHARRQGSDRGAARGQGLQRPGLRDGALRGGDRAQPPLVHAAHAHQGPQQSGRDAHRLERDGRRALRGDQGRDARAT